jgi:hypothetical protein
MHQVGEHHFIHIYEDNKSSKEVRIARRERCLNGKQKPQLEKWNTES